VRHNPEAMQEPPAKRKPTQPPAAPMRTTLEQVVLRRLEFEFEVGEAELHRVHFFFDQFWGPVRISVDGKLVIRGFRMLSLSTTKLYRFTVGDRERHEVVIELVRPRMLGGFRWQRCRAFVDRCRPEVRLRAGPRRVPRPRWPR
jgi:hypothetical protein